MFYFDKDKYLSREVTPQVKALAQKSYEKKVEKPIKKELDILNKALKVVNQNGVLKVYEKLSEERKKLITPFEISDEEFARKWDQVQYKSLGYEKFEGTFFTDKGDRVRSKTEVIIANKLFSLGIPYRYECPLTISNTTYYPDFTILNKKTREVFLFEHFGMIDDAEYRRKMFLKLKRYSQDSIVIGRNLIVTFEDSSNPFDVKVFEQIIKQYF